jgi:hypothetical protein
MSLLAQFLIVYAALSVLAAFATARFLRAGAKGFAPRTVRRRDVDLTDAGAAAGTRLNISA